MHPLIRISFALFLLCFAVQTGFAGQGSVRPVRSVYIASARIEKLDSVLNKRVSVMEVKKESELTSEEANTSGKICSCQVLNLESSNFDHRYVVLLAEKKNDGSAAAYAIARDRIQKEKKHLKQMFYDKVKVVSEMEGTGSCKEMYYRLRKADVSLKLYEILNADIN